MDLKGVAIILLTCTFLLGYSDTTFAEDVCYNVAGNVLTENVNDTLQIGSMSLTLSNPDDGSIVFEEENCSLVGNITGANLTQTFLSHTARCSQGDSFVTNKDEAILAYPYVRRTIEGTVDGTPCSFYIHENITEIIRGTRFFRNVGHADIDADGYISNCPGENENSFVLSGVLCVD